MNRRRTLKLLAAAAVLPRPLVLYAAPATEARLLVVFLRGGYDAASLLVPYGSDFYYESRPAIAIARPGAAPNGALELDGDWALHPALRNSLLPLYERGELAFVAYAGTRDLSRSHFETQDTIELGQPHERVRNYQSGFLNRLTAALSGRARPMSFTDRLPTAYRGEVQIPNMALRIVRRPAVEAREESVIAEMYRSTALARAVEEGFSVRAGVMQEMAAAEMEASGRSAISARGFELEARRIARLMREKFNIGFVDVGGWDTHVGQGAAVGYLANRLEELGRGLAAYAEGMGPAWRDTVVVVLSEFGRTFRENGNVGTDHGHGSVYWVAGGAVRGRRIAGEQLAVRRETLHENRDYAVLNEYRGMLGGLFARMYGLGAARLEHVFPEAKPVDLGLL